MTDISDRIPDGSEIVWIRDARDGQEVASKQLSKDSSTVTKTLTLRRILHNTREPSVTARFERTSKLRLDGTPRQGSEKDCSINLSDEEMRILLGFLERVELIRARGAAAAFRQASLSDTW